MNLTEKGQVAFNLALEHYPTGLFSAAELTEKSGHKINAATLNGIVARGYMKKYAGTPVKFEFVDNIKELIEIDKTIKKGCDNINLVKAKKEQR